MEDTRELQIFKKKEEAKDMHIIKKNRVIRPVERQKMRPWMIDLLDRNCVPGLCWQNRKDRIFRISWKHAAHTCFSQSKDTDLFERWALHTGRKYNDDDHKRWKANFRCALNSLPDVVELKDLGVKKGNNAFRVYKFLDESDPQVKMAKYNARKSVKALQRGIDLSKISVNQLKSEAEVKTILFQSPTTTSSKKRKPNSHSEVEAVQGLELLSQTAAMTSPLTSGGSALSGKKSVRSIKGGAKTGQGQTVMLTTANTQDKNQPVTLTLTIQGQGYLRNLNVGVCPITDEADDTQTQTIILPDDVDLEELQSSGATICLKQEDSLSPAYCELVTEDGDNIPTTVMEEVVPVEIEIQDVKEDETVVEAPQSEITTEVPFEKEEVVELPSVTPDSEEGAKNLSYMYLCHWCQECFPSKVLLLSHFLMLHQEMLITSHASIEPKTSSEVSVSDTKEGIAKVDTLKPSTSTESSSESDCLKKLAQELCVPKKESEALDLRVVVKKNEGGEYLQPLGAEHESALDLSLKKFESNATKTPKKKAEKTPKRKSNRKVIRKKKKKLKVKVNKGSLKKTGSILESALLIGKTEKSRVKNEPESPTQQSGSDSDNIWDHTYHRDNEINTDGSYTTTAVSAETKIELQKHLSNQQSGEKKQKVCEIPLKDTMMYCAVCSLCFPKILFRDHLKSHRDCLPFKCAVCDMAYSDKTLLQLHSNIHKKKNVFECEYCWKIFLKEEQLMKHRKMHKKFICIVCHCDFDSVELLKKHQEDSLPDRHLGYRCRHDDEDEPKMCKHCNNMYIHHISHMKSHIEDESFNMFECSICNVSFKEGIELSDHVKMHSLSSEFENNPDIDPITKACNGVSGKNKTVEEKSHLSNPESGSAVEYHITDISELEVEITEVSCEMDAKENLSNKKEIKRESVEKKFVLKAGVEYASRCPSFQPSDSFGYLCDICQKTFSNIQAMKSHRILHRREAEGVQKDVDELQCAGLSKKLKLDTRTTPGKGNTVANASELKKLLMHKPRPLRSAKEVRSWKSGSSKDASTVKVEEGRGEHLGTDSVSSIGDVFQVVKLPIKTKKFSFEINVPVYKPLHSAKSGVGGDKVDESAQLMKFDASDGTLYKHVVTKQSNLGEIQPVTDIIPESQESENQFCQWCKIKLKDRAALINHIEVMHSSRTVFRCYVCGRLYLSRSNLRHHMSCHEAKKYKCRLCAIAFSTISKLKKHTLSQRHRLRIARLFPNKRPNIAAKSQESPSTDIVHRCGICQASFQKVYQLLRHNKVSHSHHCGKKRDSKFMSSMRKRSREKICMVCGQYFDYAGNLQLHMLEHVDEELANISDTGSDDQSTSSQEKKTKSHCCSICFKELSSRNSLNRHRLIHTGVKPYRCPLALCQFRCNQRGNLSVHMRTHHKEVATLDTIVADKKK